MTHKPTEMELMVAEALKEYRALEPQHSDYINAARAAIRAMRNPTDEMLFCGYAAGYAADDGVDEVTEVLAEIVYTAMIRAASPEDE